jgi:hypothetical protein
MNFFKRVIDTFSDRDDYEAAISAIQDAILSRKLSPQDNRQKATEFVEPKGWRSRIDGIDWVEVLSYAEENEMPFESVTDLLSILKSMKGKTRPQARRRL